GGANQPGQGRGRGRRGNRPAVAAQPAAPAGGLQGAFSSFNTDANNLYLRLTSENDTASQDMQVYTDQEFTTYLYLKSGKTQSIDQLRLVLDYNPSYITPISI